MEAQLLALIGEQKVISLPNGESMPMKALWQDRNTLVVFFRRWGCMLCHLWARELGQIAPILKKHDIRLVGIGVEKSGSNEFIHDKHFDGELFYVEEQSTYQSLGFKHFNVFSIIASLFWQQSRHAIYKGKDMGLKGDLKGDWGQTGGALLVDKSGKLLRHFVQTGPADHLHNLDILKLFGLEEEYDAQTMANDVTLAKVAQCPSN